MGKQYKVDRHRWNSGRIRALRHHLRLTQREMADRLGKHQQGISEWERGISKPRHSSTALLSIIAEQAKFDSEAVSSKETA